MPLFNAHPTTVKLTQCRSTEAALHSRSFKKVFWKYTAKLQENTHAEVYFSTLLKSHLGIGIF